MIEESVSQNSKYNSGLSVVVEFVRKVSGRYKRLKSEKTEKS